MAAGMTVAGISGREHGSGSKRSFPRRISARCRCHPPPSAAPPFRCIQDSRSIARRNGRKQGVLTQIAWILAVVSKAAQEMLKHVG